jgi:tetratricopeptide (TPR) repeat protein
VPLASFFREQLAAVEAFLASPDQVVRRVLVDGEMRPILLKMLAGRDAEDEFPHVLLGYQAAFNGPVPWFAGMQDMLEAELAEHGAALAGEGVDVSDPAKNPAARGPWPFLLRAERLTEALPNGIGALAFVLDPAEVLDHASYVKSIAFLADNVRSPWLKFIVLEQRTAPALAALDGAERVGTQVFWASPQELEARVTARLGAGSMVPAPERQRLLAMAASFASANRDHARAVALQREHLVGAEAPLERALGGYGLGNALLAAGEAEAAAEAFLMACALCNDHGLNELAPMTYTNLGVSLHRLGRFDEAFGALRVASNFFRAQGNRPGEAFVCDNLAAMHLELGRQDDAARVWRYALGLYDGITNPALADVRDSGRADIAAKLERAEADG